MLQCVQYEVLIQRLHKLRSRHLVLGRTLFRQTAFVAVQVHVVRVTQGMGVALKQSLRGSRETVQW